MLQYKNGKFQWPGISVCLPDGFYLETEPEYCYEYGFGAWTSDLQCYIQWEIEMGCTGTERELSSLFGHGNGLEPFGEVQPIVVNGLSGHQAMYKSQKEQKEYWEVLLDLGGGAQLRFLVWPKWGGIQEYSQSPDVQAALHGINRQ